MTKANMDRVRAMVNTPRIKRKPVNREREYRLDKPRPLVLTPAQIKQANLEARGWEGLNPGLGSWKSWRSA